MAKLVHLGIQFDGKVGFVLAFSSMAKLGSSWHSLRWQKFTCLIGRFDGKVSSFYIGFNGKVGFVLAFSLMVKLLRLIGRFDDNVSSSYIGLMTRLVRLVGRFDDKVSWFVLAFSLVAFVLAFSLVAKLVHLVSWFDGSVGLSCRDEKVLSYQSVWWQGWFVFSVGLMANLFRLGISWWKVGSSWHFLMESWFILGFIGGIGRQ